MNRIEGSIQAHGSVVYNILTAVIITVAVMVAGVMILTVQSETRMEHFMAAVFAAVAAVRSLYNGHLAKRIEMATNGMLDDSKKLAAVEAEAVGVSKGSQLVASAVLAARQAGLDEGMQSLVVKGVGGVAGAAAASGAAGSPTVEEFEAKKKELLTKKDPPV